MRKTKTSYLSIQKNGRHVPLTLQRSMRWVWTSCLKLTVRVSYIGQHVSALSLLLQAPHPTHPRRQCVNYHRGTVRIDIVADGVLTNDPTSHQGCHWCCGWWSYPAPLPWSVGLDLPQWEFSFRRWCTCLTLFFAGSWASAILLITPSAHHPAQDVFVSPLRDCPRPTIYPSSYLQIFTIEDSQPRSWPSIARTCATHG